MLDGVPGSAPLRVGRDGAEADAAEEAQLEAVEDGEGQGGDVGEGAVVVGRVLQRLAGDEDGGHGILVQRGGAQGGAQALQVDERKDQLVRPALVQRVAPPQELVQLQRGRPVCAPEGRPG